MRGIPLEDSQETSCSSAHGHSPTLLGSRHAFVDDMGAVKSIQLLDGLSMSGLLLCAWHSLPHAVDPDAKVFCEQNETNRIFSRLKGKIRIASATTYQDLLFAVSPVGLPIPSAF